MDFRFRKEERLIHRKAFETLINEGKVYFSYPLRIMWSIAGDKATFPAEVAFAVPKKKYKRANKRNILKRRMREAYRLNKHMLYTALEEKEKRAHILMVYIGNEILPYHDIEKKTIGFFKHMVDELKKMVE